MTSWNGLRASYDAVVVGARVAGAATAMLLARQGRRVLLVDRSRYGSDTLSTHALMRGGVYQLCKWGLLGDVVASGTPAVRQTSFHYGNEVVNVPIPSRDGVDALYAPRRTTLDSVLVDAAIAAGVDVLHGVGVVELLRASPSGSRVSGVVLQDSSGRLAEIRARLVVGADGRHSSVARLVGADSYRRARYASGVIYGYWSGVAVEGYHWFFERGISAGAIPTNDSQTCIFVACPSTRFAESIRYDLDGSYHQILSTCAPQLQRELSRAQRHGRLRGFAGEKGYFRQSHGAGWALVGDAGYFKDPLTAHGITDALRDAELVARSVAVDGEAGLASYQRARDALSMKFFDLTEQVASFRWDLIGIRELHLQMSREMKREVETLQMAVPRAPASAQALTPRTPQTSQISHTPMSDIAEPVSTWGPPAATV